MAIEEPTQNEQSSTSDSATSAPKGMTVSPDKSSSSKKQWLIMLIVVVVVAGVALLLGRMLNKSNTSPTTTTHRIVKLGLVTPLTGDVANYGQVTQRGVELAESDFNQPNLTFQILVRDSQCDPALAATETTELVKAGVVAIIGDTCSGSTLAMVPVAAKNHVAVISAGASSIKLSGVSPYFERTYPTDSHQAVFTTQMMYQHGVKKLAIMYSDEAYGSGLNTTATTNYKSLGGTVVADDSFPTTQVNFQSQLQAIQADKPDALYITTNSESAAAAIVVEAKQLGMTMPIYGSDALKDNSFLSDVGTSGENMTVVAVTPGNTKFLDEYKASYGSEPANSTGAQAYDAFMAIARAVKDGATNGTQISQDVAKLDFQGVSGKIKFDSNHDLAGGGYNVYTIKGGQFVLTAQSQ